MSLHKRFSIIIEKISIWYSKLKIIAQREISTTCSLYKNDFIDILQGNFIMIIFKADHIM